MGFNATVVVLLDGLHEIEKDPNFGKALSQAIMQKYHHNDQKVWIPCGSHANVAQVAEVHHADQTVYVRVGQNCGIPMDLKSVTKKYVTLKTEPVCERWG